MTYKIVSDLKWLPARGIVRENNFSTVVAPSQKDDLNPNGLFSGFSCEGLFYTSRWTGTKFVEHSFSITEITKFCSLELESEVTEKELPKEAPKKKETVRNPYEGFRIPVSKESARPLKHPEQPFKTRDPFSKSSESNPLSFPTKILLGDKEYDMKSFKLEDFLENSDKIKEGTDTFVSELSKLFGTSKKEDPKG